MNRTSSRGLAVTALALLVTGLGATCASSPAALEPPVILAFAPASGPVGVAVTVTGSGFDPQPGNDTVRFDGTQAQVTAATATSLTAVVPWGARSGPLSVSVAGATAVSAGAFTVLDGGSGEPPTITAQPADAVVSAGQSATFAVVAQGTPPLSYAWSFAGQPLPGDAGASYTVAGAAVAQAGGYQVTVRNALGSVASRTAVLTVVAQAAAPDFGLTGFAAGTTGGGVLAETDAAYRHCTTPLELATAIRDANQGTVKVIEVMNDLDLGWVEVGASVRGLASTPFRAHNAPLLHPALLARGVSLIDVKPPAGGLTLFSANGATLRHATINVKSTSNVIIRNLRFDELWEWDEATKGQYDKQDWDFIDLGNGGTPVHGVWIDHCTFTKTYDGVVDLKGGTSAVTFSWNRYVGDDGATNPQSFVRQQFAALEAQRASNPMYDFFRARGFGVEDLVAIHQGHDKTHLLGGTALDPTNAALSVTFHHQWYQNTWDRLPRLRAGQVHVYDILADDTDAAAALARRNALVAALGASDQATANTTYSLKPPLNGSISTEGGAVLVEKSVYVDCLWPLRNNQTSPSDPTYTGKIVATDTVVRTHAPDGKVTEVRGDSTDPGSPLGPTQAPVIPFSWNTFSTLPYAYAADDPVQLEALLHAYAGAGVLTWPKDRWLRTSY
jgi:pectate lyase